MKQAECLQLKEDIARQLARCRTVFQLGDIDPEVFRADWKDSSSSTVPPWVPRLVDLMQKSNWLDRAGRILNARERVWQHDRGRGGEYRSYAWFHEVVVHEAFIDALQDAGFEVSDWTSVPNRNHHNVLAGNKTQLHIIVGSQPGTCRSIHLNLIYHPENATYPYPPSPFEGRMTEIQVAYREP